MALAATQLADGRIEQEQRFRASLIASVSVHLGAALALILVPLLFGRTVIMPNVLPVQLLPPSPPPAPAEQPAPAEEPEPETPEPEQPEQPEPEAVASEPEPIPRSIEDLRREQQREEEAAREAERRRREEAERRQREEEQRRRDEEEQRRREEEERRRRDEEERRRREEEARAQPQRARRTPPTQSARREAIDITGTEESQTSFTVEDFPFAAYLMRIRDMVAARWDPPPRGQNAPEVRGEVFFRIGRDGRLVVQPRMLDRSSNTLFDQAAMRAIASAAPFPPLPREYQGQSLGVRFAFIHE